MGIFDSFKKIVRGSGEEKKDEVKTTPVKPAAQPYKIGDRITGRYEIHDIKRGGMGIVFLCYDHEFKDAVAIKTFQDKYLTSKESIDRFMWEAETWVRLEKHKNIVRANNVQIISDRPYIFLEFVVGDKTYGSDLTGWIWGNGLDLNTTLSFAIQFCLGMEHAEKKFREMDKPFIHRDIKPGNIMVTQDKIIKITDFGLVKTFMGSKEDINIGNVKDEDTGAERYGFSMAGSICGTPPYMSPEECRGEIEIDTRSDIYSFGCVLYEMLTGKPPFEGPHFDNYRAQHMTVKPRVPKELAPDIPDKLNYLVMKCLEKEPSKRYHDFKSLREGLSEIYLQQTRGRFKTEETSKELEAWEWNFKGISLTNLGKNQEALACYERAIEIDPRYTIAWHNKGATLQKLGKNHEAIACYDKALEINPYYAIAWSNKGRILGELGKYEDAIACCKRAIELQPYCGGLFYNMGTILRSFGKHQDAIAYFDSALNINRRNVEAWYSKGFSLGFLGKPKEAIVCFDTALEINPRCVDAWHNKGTALIELGKHREGMYCFNKALEIAPKYAEAWFNKGVVLVNYDLYQESIFCFDKALEINPKYVNAWHNKGVVLSKSGKYKDAIEAFQNVIRFTSYKSIEDIEKINKIIRQLEKML